MRRIFGTMATAALLLTAVSAGAQTAMPNQGQPSQTPMQNMPMMQGQQGGTMPGQQSAPMGCPMMKQMAMLQERVQQLEQKTGIPSPMPPSTPQVQ
ncbi:hypothetical protein SAE02_69410 [Skermanella aerolata]|uniref:Uncharacterized protein n=1 Tax=Skermanella aerolata TaxID=393310 RepID=A0A512E229_9PROT|nr:hypothetical protein [Skermanella aerolata]KJB91138.1 hypothetical protein N826_31880 [Skermanella aerolata KACC 11604]GEO42793.1 hypothetical protein SAE02_69410 [Skermanella aerolata]